MSVCTFELTMHPSLIVSMPTEPGVFARGTHLFSGGGASQPAGQVREDDPVIRHCRTPEVC